MILPYSNRKHIITEIVWMFGLLPFWWVLGIEQFIWFGYLLVVFVKYLYANKNKFRTNFIHQVYFTFLFFFAVSIVNIDQPMRYITFFRNIFSFTSVWLIMIVVHNAVNKWSEVKRILNVLVMTLFFASLIAVITFFFEGARFKIKSVLGFFLPSGIANTATGSLIINRELGDIAYFVLFGGYFRTSSFFVFASMFASLLALVIPFVLYLINVSKGFQKKKYYIILITMFAALTFTTGRMAVLALLIALTYLYLYILPKPLMKYFLVGISVITAIFLVFAFFQYPQLMDIIDAVVNSRGEGSKNTRMSIYVNTFESLKEHPIIGWGTQRDGEGMHYPMGSHSFYLGILYKYGIVGLILFLGFLRLVFKKVKINRLMKNSSDEVKSMDKFLKYGRVILFVIVINGISDEFDLDASLMIMMGALIALLIKTSDLINEKQKQVISSDVSLESNN